MYRFVVKNIHNGKFVYPFSSSTLLTSTKSIESCSNETSFIVNYLINSCGLSPEKALSASKNVKIQAEKADSVLAFLKDHGFTNTQISKVVNGLPRVLSLSPKNILLPKIEFLKSKSVSASYVVTIIVANPEILRRGLKTHLIPAFNLLHKFLKTDEKTIAAFRRNIWFINEKNIEDNVEMLKQVGVADKSIEHMIMRHPTVCFMKKDKLKETVEKVMKLGFNPIKMDFMLAILAFRSMTKTTWDRKVEVYRQWGWSEDDILVAFRKTPYSMMLAEDKINSMMEFWVNKMGWKPSRLANRPTVMSFSLKKRIAPRYEVYRLLVSKGLLTPGDSKFATMLLFSEKCFLEKFVEPYKEEAPDLWKLYKQKLDLSE